MKKKIAYLFLTSTAVFSLLGLASCKKSGFSGKVFLDYGYIRENKLNNITETNEITYNQLKSKVEVTKESFMLVTYNGTCSCWSDFQPVITRFINETNVKVEYINVDMFIDKDNTFDLYLEKISLPNVALFSRGKMVRQAYLKNDASDKMFKDYDSFKTWADENVVLPKMYYLERNVLDSYIAQNKTFDLYIARSECPDCQAINYDVLYDYSDNHATLKNNLYIFDIQSYRDGDPDVYQGIKDQYGLTTKNNPTFGYDLYGGVVPTFQHREGGTIKDMVSLCNDTKVDNKVSSYFTTERVNAMTFLKNSSLSTVLNSIELSDSQVADWKNYSKEFYKNYHYPIAIEYLNYYLNN